MTGINKPKLLAEFRVLRDPAIHFNPLFVCLSQLLDGKSEALAELKITLHVLVIMREQGVDRKSKVSHWLGKLASLTKCFNKHEKREDCSPIHLHCTDRRKEGNVLFNDALNTFYLRLHCVRHMVKNHSDS